MSEDAEKKILKIYDGSRPVVEDLYETNMINQLAWSIVVVLAGMVLWCALAVINAENQRYALETKKCEDPVFKGEIDKHCLQVVSARDHWWENLWYGLTHLRPEDPGQKVVNRKK